MRRSFCLIVLGLMPIVSPPLVARTLSFPDQNFQCEISDTWSLSSATGFRVEAYSPNHHVVFMVITMPGDPNLTIDSPVYLQRARDSYVRSGFEVLLQKYTKIGNQRFSFWQVQPPNFNPIGLHPTWDWNIMADSRIYSITVTGNVDPASDPELTAMVNSFQFILPAHIHVAPSLFNAWSGTPGAEAAEGYQRYDYSGFLGWLVCYIVFFPILGIGLIICLIKWRERKRRPTNPPARP
jgi:hypothetical protein